MDSDDQATGKLAQVLYSAKYLILAKKLYLIKAREKKNIYIYIF